MAAPGACPLCGHPLEPGALVCGNCGAKIPAPAPPKPPPAAEVLAEQLDDLKDTVVQEAIVDQLTTLEREAEETAKVATEAVAELAGVEEQIEEAEERLEAAEADLTDFVRKVEKHVTRQAHAPVPPPKRSAAGPVLLAAGGLLFATGLFLLPDALLVGAFTFLIGVAAVAIGAAIRFGPRRQK